MDPKRCRVVTFSPLGLSYRSITPPEGDREDAISCGLVRRTAHHNPKGRRQCRQESSQEPGADCPGALEAAQKLRASATTAGIPETTLYLQRFAGPFGRED
jgi:hypothetical protein